MSIQTDNLSSNFSEARIISATPTSPQEEAIERALRPKQLDEYVGQEKFAVSWRFLLVRRANAKKRSITPYYSAHLALARQHWHISSRAKWA